VKRKKFIILDLDNCISDDSWRISFIDWKQKDPDLRYKNYLEAAPLDMCKNRELFNLLDEGIIILTARPERFRPQTERWLQHIAGLKFDWMLMRGNDEHDPSEVVKAAQLDQLLTMGIAFEDIVVCYDDRQSVIDYYRSIGLRAERKWIHNTPYGVVT
jgi:hypothetical protein